MTVQTLPTIDLSGYGESIARSNEVALQLDAACREFGFFYLVGHGIDPARVARLESLSRRFFASDVHDKMRIRMALGGRAWRGYFPVGGELTSGKPDWKEGIYFGTELEEADDRVRRGIPLHGRNLFPQDDPSFRESVLSYIADLTDLGQRLAGAIALGLGLPEEYFVEHYTADPTVLFRIFNYPPQPDAPAESWGVGAHTDYGLLTLLKQDEVGGLQVRHGTDWIDVPHVRNSFVCNVGDMLERLTRGRYLSALHRARNASAHHRLSLAFFFDPGFDARLEPLPNVQAAATRHTNVRWDDVDPNAVQGTYGEYLLGKVGKVFPDLGSSVLTPDQKE